MDLENGWRILIVLAAAPCAIAIPLIHICDESVRFLVIQGRVDEAKAVLDKMADDNKVARIEGEIIPMSPHPVTILDVFRRPFTRFVFNRPLTEKIKCMPSSKTILWLKFLTEDVFRRSIVIAIMFGVTVWVFYGFLYLLPDMMSYGYCHMSEFFDVTYVDSTGCTVYTKAEYLFLLVVNMIYIPGYIISPITAGKQTIIHLQSSPCYHPLNYCDIIKLQ